MPNVTDRGFIGGNEGVRTHVLPNDTDVEFLEAILCHHMDPSMFFMRGMEALKKAAEEPLYDESKGCTKEFMTLWSVLKLLMLKGRYGLSDAGFDVLLSINVGKLPKENKVPANMYYAKKLISSLTMGVEKIHVCRNHCILYWGDDYKDLESCTKCGVSRYKMDKKTIKRKSVLPSYLKGRSERRPNRRREFKTHQQSKRSRLLCA